MAQKPPLSPIPVAGPFDCIGVDVIQFPCRYDGHKYSLEPRPYTPRFYLTALEKNRFLQGCEIKSWHVRPGFEAIKQIYHSLYGLFD